MLVLRDDLVAFFLYAHTIVSIDPGINTIKKPMNLSRAVDDYFELIGRRIGVAKKKKSELERKGRLNLKSTLWG